MNECGDNKLGKALIAGLVSGALASGISPALAAKPEPDKVLTLGAGLDRLTDSNIFRMPEGGGTRDQVSSSFVTLLLDKTLSRQRLRVDAAVHDYRFQDNDYLNHRAVQGAMAWDWRVTSRFEGVLGADYSESLNSFADYHSTTKNIRTRQKYYVEGRGRAIGNAWLLAGASCTEQENDELFLSEDDYRIDGVDTGISYKTKAGNTLSLVMTQGDGSYSNRVLDARNLIDSGFEQTETQLRLHWQFSGHTGINGYLGHLEREHDHYNARDFSGETGEIRLEHALAADVQLNVSARQDLVSYQTSPLADAANIANGQSYYNSSYYRLQALRIAPVWQFSDKITFRAGYEQGRRNFEGGLSPALEQRDDKLRTLSLGAEWIPVSWLKLSVLAAQDKRTSNIDHADFVSDRIGAAFSFLY